jgi:hypothetical protein
MIHDKSMLFTNKILSCEPVNHGSTVIKIFIMVIFNLKWKNLLRINYLI